MNVENFLQNLTQASPPEQLSEALRALWYDAKEDWHAAHEIAQNLDSPEGAWIHAYLHRKEGDNWNADYWYSRAGKTRPDQSLAEEWKYMVEAML